MSPLDPSGPSGPLAREEAHAPQSYGAGRSIPAPVDREHRSTPGTLPPTSAAPQPAAEPRSDGGDPGRDRAARAEAGSPGLEGDDDRALLHLGQRTKVASRLCPVVEPGSGGPPSAGAVAAPRRATFPNLWFDVEANTGRGWRYVGSAEAPNLITAIAIVKGRSTHIGRAEWRAVFSPGENRVAT